VKRVIGGLGRHEPGPSLFGSIPVPAAQQMPELGVVQDGMAAPDAGPLRTGFGGQEMARQQLAPRGSGEIKP